MLNILAAFGVALVAPADTFSLEMLKAEYPRIFVLQHVREAGRDLYSVEIAGLPPEHPLAEFVATYPQFLSYLAYHGTRPSFEELFTRRASPAERRTAYYRALTSDVQFNSILVPVMARYLLARGGVLIGWPLAGERTQVPLPALVRVAVRFFYPEAVTPTGFRSGIGVGIKGLRDFPGDRDVGLEAFAFQAILRDLEKPRHDVRVDYDEARRLMAELELSAEPDTRLKRAQGVMWGLMSRSERLRRVLLDEYARAATYAPFTLTVLPAGRT